MPAKRRAKRKPRSGSPLGALPEWNLSDLYLGLNDPQVKRDLERADAESVAFEQDYKGKLAALAQAAPAGKTLADAVKRYEALDDLLGRLISYADGQERATAASSHLLFFTLAVDRLADAALDAAMRDPGLGHYRRWVEDLRKEKPSLLEDRVEQLFHEKSVTAYSAWNRLFDETVATLRFRVAGRSLAIEPTMTLLHVPNEKTRTDAAQELAATFRLN